MPITAQCDSCTAKFKVKEELAGKKVKCPKCSKPFTIKAVSKAKPNPKPKPKSKPIKKAVDEFDLAPATPRMAANPMLDLLDTAGVESTPKGPVCTNCGSELSPMAIICIECGFNNDTGKQLETATYSDPGVVDSGMTDAEKILAKAEKEIDEMPVSAADQDFGDGADSFLIAGVALVGAAILVGIGLGVMFTMDKIGEEVNTGLISFFGAIGLYLFCVAWITFIAFKAKPLHGVICMFSGGLYCIIFGFMQGKALLMPTIICLISMLIGLISWIYVSSQSAMLLESVEFVKMV